MEAFISLYIRTAMPTYAITSAEYDDALFIRLARTLLHREWLGSFDNLTLVKGSGYPIFIAVAFMAGVPLNIAQELVYLAVCGVSTYVVLRISKSHALALVVFTALAFNPVLWADELSRVIREALYVSLSLGSKPNQLLEAGEVF